MGMLSRALKNPNKDKALHIDEGLYNALNEIATIRGLELSTLVQVQLHAYVNAFERGKVLSLSDEMPFGKYKGLLPENIIRADPRYIHFLLSESSVFRLDENALNLLETLGD